MGVLNRLNALFSAGAFGGMLNCVVVWFFGVIGVNQILGVDIAPAFTPEYLYPRIVWGGIWGIILFRITSYNVCYTKLLRSFMYFK